VDPRVVAEDAQAVLLVQAGQMAEPIFTRLEFEKTDSVTMLRDKSSQ